MTGNGPTTAGNCCGKAWVLGTVRCQNCPLTLPQPPWTSPNVGWQCPKCGRGNAPFVHTCPCGPAYQTWASSGSDLNAASRPEEKP